ncbi:MAG: hypothetical protein JST26_15230 [Bacteroidetes bacterium]|nr:hypothetical protein [Bacteroidota bacterium]
MSDANNIDDILKNKLREQEFAFDEQNWEKARDLIDASRRRKKRLIIFWPLIGLSLIIASVWLYMAKGTNDSTLAENHSSVVTTPTDEKSNVTEAAKQAATVSKEENINKTHKAIVSTPSNPNHVTSEKKENKRYESETNPEIKESTSMENSEKNGSSNPGSHAVTGTMPGKSSKTKINTGQNQGVTNGKQITVSGNEINHPAGATEAANKTGTQDKNEKNTESQNHSESGISKTKHAGENKAAVNTDSEAMTYEAEPAYMIPVQVRFTDAPADGSIVLLNPIALPENESSSETTTPLSKAPRHLVYADFGGSYLLGWKNAAKREGDGINLTGGISYQFIANSGIGVSAGVQYNAVGHLINSSYVVNDTRYSFGKEETVTVIEQKRLHYITMPVRFIFAQGTKRYFGIGCNFGYLVNSQNLIKKYEFMNGAQSPVSAPNTTLTENFTAVSGLNNPVSSSNTTGYRRGFNPYDLQLTAFYRQPLYERVTIGAEVFFGMMDIKQNSFFKSSYFDRNYGLKITIGCDLFKK